MSRFRIGILVWISGVALAMFACSAYAPFDSEGHLRERFSERLDADSSRVVVPFALDDDIRGLLDRHFRAALDEERRLEQVQEVIFSRLRLRYSLEPTRDAVGTFHAAEGNCLSFVHLFVGISRHLRLNPFYVEVIDHQRWRHREGAVVSQGHIVAGMQVAGELRTFDFLPYRPKAYRNFRPIDDLRATAHHYNNLGAEALLAGRTDEALPLLELAIRLDPAFDKALNNQGVALARMGRVEEAVALYEEALEGDPENAVLLSNLARAHQRQGRLEEAAKILARLEGVHHTNPFFYLFQAELAQGRGDLDGALRALREALRRDSEIPEIHLAFVKLYLGTGELDKARHHLGRALRLDATHEEARRLAALLADDSHTSPETGAVQGGQGDPREIGVRGAERGGARAPSGADGDVEATAGRDGGPT